MKKYIFEGYSDDTFAEVNETGVEFDNCGTGEPICFEIKNEDGSGVLVVGQYAPKQSDCWMIGVGNIDQNKPLDNRWEFSINTNSGDYRNMLTVIAPESTTLRCLEAE